MVSRDEGWQVAANEVSFDKGPRTPAADLLAYSLHLLETRVRARVCVCGLGGGGGRERRMGGEEEGG